MPKVTSELKKHRMKEYRDAEMNIHVLLTLAVDGTSITRFSREHLEESTITALWVGSWVHTRDFLDALRKRKLTVILPEIRLRWYSPYLVTLLIHLCLYNKMALNGVQIDNNVISHGNSLQKKCKILCHVHVGSVTKSCWPLCYKPYSIHSINKRHSSGYDTNCIRTLRI